MQTTQPQLTAAIVLNIINLLRNIYQNLPISEKLADIGGFNHRVSSSMYSFCRHFSDLRLLRSTGKSLDNRNQVEPAIPKTSCGLAHSFVPKWHPEELLCHASVAELWSCTCMYKTEKGESIQRIASRIFNKRSGGNCWTRRNWEELLFEPSFHSRKTFSKVMNC